MDLRASAFRAAFWALDLTGANRLVAARTRGLGLVLTLHHVRRFIGNAFAPNRLLEVEPEFLDLALARAKALGFEFVTLDEAIRRVGEGTSARPFLHVTFDDGYRDVRDFALPVLKRHQAPATLYIASDFAEGEGELWWLSLEAALARADHLEFQNKVIECRTTAQKFAAWKRIYWALRAGPEENLRREVARIARSQSVNPNGFARELCMDWRELRDVAEDPLIEIGAHTVSHPMLAKHPENVVRSEMVESRAAISRELGREPRHFAYPVGDLSAAGSREYAMSREVGFASAVTTRPGHLTAAHAGALHALPRVSLNGLFQTRAAVDGLLSGAPFAAMAGLRRLAGRG